MPDKGGAQGRRVGNRCYGCERHRSTEASCRPPGHGEYKVRPFKKRHRTEPGFRPEDRFASRKRNFARARHAAGRWIRIRMHNDLYAAKVLECFECFGTTGQRFERVARTHDLHVARFKKWILAAPRGWKGELAEKLLTPVDKDGKKLVCHDVSCEGGFDWTWTQHTAWRIDEKSAPGIVYLSVFDNGDARGMEQPAMPSMKYSRAVVYKIDEKKMTVEQIWSYGEEAGHDWFSPVTSLTEYHADKDSIFVYSATAGASFDINTGAFTSAPNPYMQEFRWGETMPAVEMRVESTTGYQAMPVDIERAFEK